MRIPSIFYTTSVRKYQRKSVYKIYRKTENGWKVLKDVNKHEIHKPAAIAHNQSQSQSQEKSKAKSVDLPKDRTNHRENEMKIQMLSKSLYEQIFKNNHKPTPDEQTIQK